MIPVTRRGFLGLLGGAAAAAAVPGTTVLAAPKPESFEFLFLTDTHLEPELGAAQGTDMAFKKARGHKVDFALQGGDHVFDSMRTTKERANSVFDLYDKTEQDLGMKVHHTCGNHDCFGVESQGKISKGDPLYGKKMFEQRFGPARYSFDHKGVHFIVLDSVQPHEDQNGYSGHIDDAQMRWLAADLAKLPKDAPVIVTTHIPLVTAFESYTPMPADHKTLRGELSIDNSDKVIEIFDQYNVIGVLQGHTHIYETVTYHGVPYTTGGAVCGNWWKGSRMGTSEGYTVVRVEGGKMSTRYETYGWVAKG